MMSTRNRIDQLLEKTVDGSVSSAVVEHELRGLLDAVNDELYRTKIHNALQWAKIQSAPARSERYGDVKQVRGWLLQDLRSAAIRAGEIQGQDLQEGDADEAIE